VGARRDFDEGIRLLQAQGQGLPMGFRFSHSERTWELFAEAIRLRASSVGQGCAGLELAERARSTMWPEGASAGPNPDVSRLLHELPERADVVYYSLGARESFAWVLSRGRCDAVRLQTTEAEMERLVGLLLRQIGQHAGASRVLDTSRELHKKIIEPLHTRHLTGECLVIVPDGALHRLPFAILRDADGFLIEERPILIATSLTGFVDASRRLLQRSAPLNHALIVADPATDEAEPLPGARAEAVDLAQLYPHRTLLTGRSATRRAIWDAIPDADVLHYAGHAVDDAFHPERSRLLLARSSNDAEQGTLSVKDLFALHRRLPALVVLAACGTRGSRVYRGQGTVGLSTPFLVKGVPSVVATLWDVDDRAGTTLATAIHRAARSGDRGVINALRNAQLEQLRSGSPSNSRWDWAAYVLIAGWR
jgi:CHAT domain-containing protein